MTSNVVKKTMKMDQLLTKQADLNTIKAEMLFTCFLIEHNIPLAAADQTGSLFQAMFPESSEVKTYAAARTKTTCLVKALAAANQSDLVKSLMQRPFSVATDGGNDKATEMTLYPLVITHFDEKVGQVCTSLLSAPSLTKGGSGVNIAHLLLSEFDRLGISEEVFRKNCLSVATDNAPVMVGLKEGMMGQLRKVSPGLISMGCPCHLVNLAAEKASSCLPVAVEELLTDIFYHLEKSKKRKQTLKEFQILCDVETRRMLKHVCTRWLSLGLCLGRLLENWTPLLHFFEKEMGNITSKPASSAPRLQSYSIPKKSVSSKTASIGPSSHSASSANNSCPPSSQASKAICGSSKQPTIKFGPSTSSGDSGSGQPNNSSGKRKSPDTGFDESLSSKRKSTQQYTKEAVPKKVARVYTSLKNPLFFTYAHFLKAVVPTFEGTNRLLQKEEPLVHSLKGILDDLVQKILGMFVKSSVLKEKSPLEVNYKERRNQKDNADLFIGSATAALLKTLEPSQIQEFYDSVRAYYTAACDYMVAKFPLRDDAVINAQVSNFGYASTAGVWDNITFFVKKFPSLLLKEGNESDIEAMDKLQSQWQDFQCTKFGPEVLDLNREDDKWMFIGKIKKFGSFQFDRLAYMMLGILTLPHSNAACERVFSQVRKNKTDFRGSMSNETVSAVVVAKSNMRGPCYSQNFSREFLTTAKSATSTYLKQH